MKRKDLRYSSRLCFSWRTAYLILTSSNNLNLTNKSKSETLLIINNLTVIIPILAQFLNAKILLFSDIDTVYIKNNE